jgi:hypothetical protein
MQVAAQFINYIYRIEVKFMQVMKLDWAPQGFGDLAKQVTTPSLLLTDKWADV